MEYATVVHKCMCGCGKEVATPISPTDWCLTFNGDSISLDPSIGNWSFPCRSHYWIRNNRVLWCDDMPQSLIDAGRVRDRRAKAAYYAKHSEAPANVPPVLDKAESRSPEDAIRGKVRGGLLSRATAWLLGRK
jgi:purine nucleoside permease